MDAFDISVMVFLSLFGVLFGCLLGFGIVGSTYTSGRKAVARAFVACYTIGCPLLIYVGAWFFDGDVFGAARASNDGVVSLVGHVVATVFLVSFLVCSFSMAHSAASSIASWLDCGKQITALGDQLFVVLDLDKDGVISERDLERAKVAGIGADVFPAPVLAYLKSFISSVGHEAGFGGRTSVYIIGREDVRQYYAKLQEQYKRWLPPLDPAVS